MFAIVISSNSESSFLEGLDFFSTEFSISGLILNVFFFRIGA
jgi:hypothetical protein